MVCFVIKISKFSLIELNGFRFDLIDKLSTNVDILTESSAGKRFYNYIKRQGVVLWKIKMSLFWRKLLITVIRLRTLLQSTVIAMNCSIKTLIINMFVRFEQSK